MRDLPADCFRVVVERDSASKYHETSWEAWVSTGHLMESDDWYGYGATPDDALAQAIARARERAPVAPPATSARDAA